MRERLIVSLIAGVILSGLSLFFTKGASPPMLPCAGVRPCVLGVLLNTPDTEFGHRGWPSSIIYLEQDSDGHQKYEGYSLGNLAADVSFYAFIVLGILTLFRQLRHSESSSGRLAAISLLLFYLAVWVYFAWEAYLGWIGIASFSDQTPEIVSIAALIPVFFCLWFLSLWYRARR